MCCFKLVFNVAERLRNARTTPATTDCIDRSCLCVPLRPLVLIVVVVGWVLCGGCGVSVDGSDVDGKSPCCRQLCPLCCWRLVMILLRFLLWHLTSRLWHPLTRDRASLRCRTVCRFLHDGDMIDFFFCKNYKPLMEIECGSQVWTRGCNTVIQIHT